MNYIDNYKVWCAADLTDDMRAELDLIKNDEEELRSLCIEMGWKIDWYESYKANFPEFSI